MRWLGLMVISLAVACAASQPPMDGGIGDDLAVGRCDSQQLFAECSQQCGMPVCIVAKATCSSGHWQCDCSQTGPCRDFGGAD